MKITITGGAGFVGANLVKALELDPEIEEIVILDDFSTGSHENIASTQAKIIEGSILDRSIVEEAVSQSSAVIHLAARSSVPRSIDDPRATHDVNATGTINILEEVRKHKDIHLVVASSSSVYGNSEISPKSEDLPISPLSPYAASKLATESYTLSWANCFHISSIAFRFFNIFGPMQPPHHSYAAAIPAFLSAAFQDEPLPVFGTGEQTRDFTFVDSVTSVIIEAIRNRVSCPSPVNLAFGTQISLLETISKIENLLGKKLEIEFLEPRVGDVKNSKADNQKLKNLFPEIKPTTMDEGLAKTIEWFEDTKPWEKR
jgi:UDP-glucose 4-epimerase